MIGKKTEFVRFLAVGLLNSAVSYGLFALLLFVSHYVVAWTLAYIAGIFSSYLLNTKLTFQVKPRISSAVQFPLVYLVQYLVSLLIIAILVEVLGINQVLASIVSLPIVLPMTFLLSRAVIVGQGFRSLLARFRLFGRPVALPLQAAVPPTYIEWLETHRPNAATLEQQRHTAAALPAPPLVSLALPADGTEVELRAAIASVQAQTYANWELLLVGAPALAELALDERIRLCIASPLLSRAEVLNLALDQANGSFFGVIEAAGLLAPDALFKLVQAATQPDVELVYSDCDQLTADRQSRERPFFKPDWSPMLLLSVDYISRFCLARTALARRVGGYRADETAFRWGHSLRLSERAARIAHVAEPLYHAGPHAHWPGPEPAAQGRTVVEAWLRRHGLPAVVELLDEAVLRASWELSATPLVSIIIPTRSPQLIRRCYERLLEFTDYPRFELIVIDTTPTAEIATVFATDSVKPMVIVEQGPFNYSAVNNLAVRHARGELLLFLNDDTEALESVWLTELVRWAQREEVGVVGAQLLRADGKLQHAGVVVGLGGFAGHPFDSGAPEEETAFGTARWYRNYSAVTGACLMVRRAVFEAAGGFDERFVLCGSDVELCLHIQALGYQIVYTPFARLLHLESTTRGSAIPSNDFALSYAHYKVLLESGDPFFNPNLSYWSVRPALRAPEEEQPLASARRTLQILGVEAIAESSGVAYELRS